MLARPNCIFLPHWHRVSNQVMESDIWNGWRCNNECDVNGLWFGGSQNEPLQTPFNRSTPERRKLLYNSFNLETFIKYKPGIIPVSCQYIAPLMRKNVNIRFNRSYERRSSLTAVISASFQAAAPLMCDLLKRKWPSRRSPVHRAAPDINVDHMCPKTHDQFEG